MDIPKRGAVGDGGAREEAKCVIIERASAWSKFFFRNVGEEGGDEKTFSTWGWCAFYYSSHGV